VGQFGQMAEVSRVMNAAKESQRKLVAENRALKQRIVLIDGATPQSEGPASQSESLEQGA
jgi:hypothetical protein